MPPREMFPIDIHIKVRRLTPDTAQSPEIYLPFFCLQVQIQNSKLVSYVVFQVLWCLTDGVLWSFFKKTQKNKNIGVWG